MNEDNPVNQGSLEKQKLEQLENELNNIENKTTQEVPPQPSQPIQQPSAPQPVSPVSSVEPKPQGLGKSKGILWIGVALMGLATVGVIAYYLGSRKTVVTPALTPSSTQTPTSTPDPTANWKTYTNGEYNYSIKYPTEWEFREFPATKSGAAFRFSEDPEDPQYELIGVDVSSGAQIYKDMAFKEYVETAGIQEIQGFESLYSIEEVRTESGVIGYKTRWNYLPVGEVLTAISLPITYFDATEVGSKTIQVILDKEDYLDEYDLMLSTFKFVEVLPTTTPVSIPEETTTP